MLLCLPQGQRQLKETGSLFEIGFDLLSLAPGQNGAILVLILDMIGSWRPGNFRVRVERVTSRWNKETINTPLAIHNRFNYEGSYFFHTFVAWVHFQDAFDWWNTALKAAFELPWTVRAPQCRLVRQYHYVLECSVSCIFICTSLARVSRKITSWP